MNSNYLALLQQVTYFVPDKGVIGSGKAVLKSVASMMKNMADDLNANAKRCDRLSRVALGRDGMESMNEAILAFQLNYFNKAQQYTIQSNNVTDDLLLPLKSFTEKYCEKLDALINDGRALQDRYNMSNEIVSDLLNATEKAKKARMAADSVVTKFLSLNPTLVKPEINEIIQHEKELKTTNVLNKFFVQADKKLLNLMLTAKKKVDSVNATMLEYENGLKEFQSIEDIIIDKLEKIVVELKSLEKGRLDYLKDLFKRAIIHDSSANAAMQFDIQKLMNVIDDVDSKNDVLVSLSFAAKGSVFQEALTLTTSKISTEGVYVSSSRKQSLVQQQHHHQRVPGKSGEDKEAFTVICMNTMMSLIDPDVMDVPSALVDKIVESIDSKVYGVRVFSNIMQRQRRRIQGLPKGSKLRLSDVDYSSMSRLLQSWVEKVAVENNKSHYRTLFIVLELATIFTNTSNDATVLASLSEHSFWQETDTWKHVLFYCTHAASRSNWEIVQSKLSFVGVTMVSLGMPNAVELVRTAIKEEQKHDPDFEVNLKEITDEMSAAAPLYAPNSLPNPSLPSLEAVSTAVSIGGADVGRHPPLPIYSDTNGDDKNGDDITGDDITGDDNGGIKSGRNELDQHVTEYDEESGVGESESLENQTKITESDSSLG